MKISFIIIFGFGLLYAIEYQATKLNVQLNITLGKVEGKNFAEIQRRRGLKPGTPECQICCFFILVCTECISFCLQKCKYNLPFLKKINK